MEKKWDTVIPGDLKRLFVSGTYVPLVTKGLAAWRKSGILLSQRTWKDSLWVGHICPAGHERVGSMEKKWDTVIPADLKRLFVSGTYMSRWSRKGWQHGEKVGYCYPSGLEKTLCEWDIYVPLVTKGLAAWRKSGILLSQRAWKDSLWVGHICPVGHERVGSMEKKWDTVIPADLKRLFVSGTYMSRWSRKGWQHGEKVGYCYPSGLGKTLCEWDIYVPLVTKGLNVKLMCEIRLQGKAETSKSSCWLVGA